MLKFLYKSFVRQQLTNRRALATLKESVNAAFGRSRTEEQMTDNDSNPNIEWKKGSIGEQEKITRKTNIKQAVEYEAKKDSVFKTTPPKPNDLPAGLKKIQKKIRQLDDEDDDEDNVQIVADPLLMEQSNNSLYNALHEDEKKILHQQETNNTIRLQLETEKKAAVNLANDMTKKAGFKGLKKETLRQSLNENSITPQKTAQTLKTEFKKELKQTDKSWNKLSDKELVNLMQGVNKIKGIGGKDGDKTIKQMEAKEIVELGKEKHDDKKIARTICEKTGRKEVRKDKKKAKAAQNQMLKEKYINAKLAQNRERD